MKVSFDYTVLDQTCNLFVGKSLLDNLYFKLHHITKKCYATLYIQFILIYFKFRLLSNQIGRCLKSSLVIECSHINFVQLYKLTTLFDFCQFRAHNACAL